MQSQSTPLRRPVRNLFPKRVIRYRNARIRDIGEYSLESRVVPGSVKERSGLRIFVFRSELIKYVVDVCKDLPRAIIARLPKTEERTDSSVKINLRAERAP